MTKRGPNNFVPLLFHENKCGTKFGRCDASAVALELERTANGRTIVTRRIGEISEQHGQAEGARRRARADRSRVRQGLGDGIGLEREIGRASCRERVCQYV